MTLKSKSQNPAILMKLIAPVVMWGLGQVFEIPKVKQMAQKFDRRADKKKKGAAKGFRSAAKHALSNPAWLAAGAAAFAVGAGLMARAGRSKA